MTVGIPAALAPPIAMTVETKNVLFDFGALLKSNYSAGTTIIAIDFINVTVLSGNDPTPQSRIIGAGIITSSQWNGIANGAVVAWFGTMLAPVVYLLQCVVSLSDGRSHPSIEVQMTCYNPNGGA